MTSKGIILFDIDRTLFDTDKLNRETNKKIADLLDVDEDVLFSVKKKYTDALESRRKFDPENYIKVLRKKFNYKTPKLLEDVYYGKENIYENCVYSEVYKVLDNLSAKYSLGIFSEGTKRYQNHKFISSGLKNYFEPDLIFIFDAKDEDKVLLKIPKEAVIVDDKESICTFLTKKGFKAIWLNKNDDKESPDFPTIHKLLGLRDIIK